MMDWIYQFTDTKKDDYPDPLEEIDSLCTLDENDEPTFLLLADRPSPPMSRAICGEVVGLCTSHGRRLILHGVATVAGDFVHDNTPPNMLFIYGQVGMRVFMPLKDLQRLPSEVLPETILSYDDQETFCKGQPFVKRLTTRIRAGRGRAMNCPSKLEISIPVLTFPSLILPQKLPPFTVVGLDPTAATWNSRMAEGPKEMPSFYLRWDGVGFKPDENPLAWHLTNDAFEAEVNRRKTSLICIDGPCGTNGPRLLSDLSGWDKQSPHGSRGGELKLSRQGVNLFWTTKNTVIKFDGASRWIARSLVLFSECPEQKKIETHPHGAFTFLWRLFGGTGTPPKKSKPYGRNARMAILRSFIPDLSDGMVPNHDALDAACAALIAGLHHLGLTIPFGAANEGGEIWMPNTKTLGDLLHAQNKDAVDV